MKTDKRATLGGKLSAVLVAAGSSVGLGNIWRFPYVAGENGGGSFLLVYALCVLLLGLPILLAEFAVGRAAHRNTVGAYRTLAQRSHDALTGRGIDPLILSRGRIEAIKCFLTHLCSISFAKVRN